jgi:hypothetical protein
VEFAVYKREVTFLEALGGVISPQSFMIGKGIGDSLKEVSAQRRLEILT